VFLQAIGRRCVNARPTAVVPDQVAILRHDPSVRQQLEPDASASDVIAGHFGVAMATRARWSRVPLLALAIAAVFPDIIDFTTAAFRVCGASGLYSHSLPAIAIEAVVLGGAAALLMRSGAAGAAIAAMVVLHLVADYITGLKLLWPGGPVIGLNLYAHPVADFALEAVVTFTGWRMLRASPARDRWSAAPTMLALLLAGQAALDVASYVVGPVKPNGCPAPAVASAGKT
jgi:LexA-binding, inner membrane-associated putative hydrolase